MWIWFFVWMVVRALAFVVLDALFIHDIETVGAFFLAFTLLDLELTTERNERRKRKGWA